MLNHNWLVSGLAWTVPGVFIETATFALTARGTLSLDRLRINRSLMILLRSLAELHIVRLGVCFVSHALLL